MYSKEGKFSIERKMSAKYLPEKSTECTICHARVQVAMCTIFLWTCIVAILQSAITAFPQWLSCCGPHVASSSLSTDAQTLKGAVPAGVLLLRIRSVVCVGKVSLKLSQIFSGSCSCMYR